MCGMDYIPQQQVLVIFHLKCDLQYDLIFIFLFPSLCSRIHINMTALFNSCLAGLLSFGPWVKILNLVELPLCKTTVKRELQLFSLGSST